MASDGFNALIELMRSNPRVITDDLDVVAQRERLEAMAGVQVVPDDVAVEAVDAGGVPCERIAAPGASTDRWLLYLHGGAYTAGSLNTHRAFCATLSRATGATVLNADYRLAPEHPHPGAVDDAVTAWQWLLDVAGADPAHATIAGDSAGGGLTAATVVALRDRELPAPGGAVLISPWLDLSLSGESMDTRAAADPMCSRESLAPSAAAYLAGADAQTPTASPLFADLNDLPPLLVHVGDAEVLLDDATRFAARAADAGVDVTIDVQPEMIHVWHLFGGFVPESDAAVAEVARWLEDKVWK